MYSLQKLFIQVVEAGSFKKAAEQMHVEPSSVSRKIATLEKRLNVKLLHQSTRQTHPTELGKKYYQGLRRLLDEEIALEEEITSGVTTLRGKLRISAPVDFGAKFVVPVVQEMLNNSPELSAELLLGSSFMNLVEKNIDVAVRIGKLSKSNLIAQKVGNVPRVLVASNTYLKNFGTPKTPEDLVNYNFIFYSPTQAKSDLEFADGSKFSYLKMQSNITVNSVNAILALVKNGLGIHLGPMWLFQEALEKGEVSKILPNYALKSYPVHAVYVAHSYLPRKTKEFIQQLSENINAKMRVSTLTTKQLRNFE